MLFTFTADEFLSFDFVICDSAEEAALGSCQDFVNLPMHPDSSYCTDVLIQKLHLAAKNFLSAMQKLKQGKIRVLSNSKCEKALRESVFLFGGCLILTHRMEIDFVADSFGVYAEQPLLDLSENQKIRVTILDCWQALQHVRDIGWMSWKDGTDDHNQPFLVDEFLHYADSTNGGVHIVAPGQLLLFTDPVDLPDQQQWAVVVSDQDDGSCSRRFSPAFYADLFADLGVAAVVCLTESTTSSAAFTARDIEARDLRHEGSGSLLRTLDGLLSLSRGAEVSGGIAVHGGGEAEWMSETSMLVATWLVSRAGFGERAAYGWLQLLCPWLPMPGAVRVGRRREANGTRASVLPAQSCYSTRDGRSAPPPADRSEEG